MAIGLLFTFMISKYFLKLIASQYHLKKACQFILCEISLTYMSGSLVVEREPRRYPVLVTDPAAHVELIAEKTCFVD